MHRCSERQILVGIEFRQEMQEVNEAAPARWTSLEWRLFGWGMLMALRGESMITETPKIELETLAEIINGAAAVGHALSLLEPKVRSRTTIHLLNTLAEMRKLGETTESFIVNVAIETARDVTYPKRLLEFLVSKQT